MTTAGKAMLFLPPRAPVPLPDDACVAIGRSRSCEVTLASPDASRRHAEIVPVPAGHLLRDLGSTNGTLVNGERVEECTLASGDRIEIGNELLTFCHVDATLDPGSQNGEAPTMLVERPALGGCVQGDFAQIPPFALLQMLEMGRNTGVLQIEGGAEAGCLWLHEGVPIHAESKTQRGFDAALAIIATDSGRFSFERNRAAPERTIEASVTELLLEASRQLDELR
jgi:pSer/pThr/pTyr-binding forkhead associated (FHA) protein